MARDQAVTSAVSSEGLEIPLIDFSRLSSADSHIKLTTAQAILSGFQRAGFVYLKNHGIPRATVSATFDESAKFFKRPLQQKTELAWTTPESNRGYVAHGREKVTDLTNVDDIEKLRDAEGPDLKESLEIGRDGEVGHPNMWPDKFDEEGKAFKNQMVDFFSLCMDLHVQFMRAIAIALSIPETWFDSFCDGGDNTLRLLHYPEVAASVFENNKNRVRAGAHTDYGSVTLLFQDSAGGLQVLSPSGTFVDATPIPDTIVVNAGDLLARWSNDTIKSTKHRVIQLPTAPVRKSGSGEDVHPARYSIAYFCNPNFDRLIETIPGTYDEVEGKKHDSVNSGQYLVQRLAATY
ncbi:hypothetical protein LTR66_001403 [Elasticomyces elasticus]|nr:hypothetical protein LTR66_001403 [Elasticomyces elasticus]